MENNFEAMDLDPVNIKKKICIPILIGTLIALALSFLSPFAIKSLIVCILYIAFPLALIVCSIIKRKDNKIALIIFLNIVSILINAAILFTHLCSTMFTETII